MAWIIRKTANPNRWLINGDGELKGTMVRDAIHWDVTFEKAATLNSVGMIGSFEEAVGYVRGVERAVTVTGRKPPRVPPGSGSRAPV